MVFCICSFVTPRSGHAQALEETNDLNRTPPRRRGTGLLRTSCNTGGCRRFCLLCVPRWRCRSHSCWRPPSLGDQTATQSESCRSQNRIASARLPPRDASRPRVPRPGVCFSSTHAAITPAPHRPYCAAASRRSPAPRRRARARSIRRPISPNRNRHRRRCVSCPWRDQSCG